MDMSRWPEMKERIAAAFATKTRDEWSAIFEDRDACVYPVLDVREAHTHRHNRARSVHIEANGVRQPAVAPRLGRTPGEIGRPPPATGQHTREVLAEAGYTADEIDKLIAGAIVS
jgi:alpha-methylacyl-CoA racemase